MDCKCSSLVIKEKMSKITIVHFEGAYAVFKIEALI